MSATTEHEESTLASARRSRPVAAFALIFVCYAAARTLEVLPTAIPRTAIVALDVIAAMAFALVDGARHYGWRGILVFAALCTVIGNIIENLGVMTGFPFGRYEFVELMGPKLFNVPVLLGLAYIGMAYVSWMLARVILGDAGAPRQRARILAKPLLASFIMVAWDLAQDPVWATLLHGWIWRDGGPWFGVPVSNYFGWYFTVFLIYVAFAFYLRRRLPGPVASRSSAYWPAVMFYALGAFANVMQAFAQPATETVQDATGRVWRAADITAASALVSILVMGAFVALAAARLLDGRAPATD